MRWLVYVLTVLAAFFAGIVALGYTLEPVRSSKSSNECHASARDLLATVLDVESQPQWRKGLVSVQRSDQASAWVERTHLGEQISFKLVDANERFVSMAFVSDRGYSGSWVAGLVEYGAARTTITAKEEVAVENPINRVISRLFFDPDAFVADHLSEWCSEAKKRASRRR
jgi:hypothetical protein